MHVILIIRKGRLTSIIKIYHLRLPLVDHNVSWKSLHLGYNGSYSPFLMSFVFSIVKLLQSLHALFPVYYTEADYNRWISLDLKYS